jgi:hypothetical protein
MSRLNIEHEKVILIALAKLFSDQSAYVIGELKQQEKMRFNIAVNAVDSFINEIESKLSDHAASTLEILTASLNDGMTNLRNELK